MREISLDTETTGLSAEDGDRIVELGCVELINHVPTGEVFHAYFNPGRPMSEKATEITGITDEFLRDKPPFSQSGQAFLSFIGDAKLVIHNAKFDIGFLNAELRRLALPVLSFDRVVDTLMIAKKRFPGSQANLDALCRRFAIDNSKREKHGALLDAELLAEVYLELIGGRQPGFALARRFGGDAASAEDNQRADRPRRSPRRATEEERSAHAAFITSFGDAPLWRETDMDVAARLEASVESDGSA